MRAPREASAFHQTNHAVASCAHAEICLLGVCVMTGLTVGRKFSLACLRNGLHIDDLPPPRFRRSWFLRDEARRAAAIFLEAENAFETVAREQGLTIHTCPSDSQFALLTRVGTVVHWPQTSTEKLRRKRRG